MLMMCDQMVRSPGYFWTVMDRRFGAELKAKVKGLRMTQDGKVCVCVCVCCVCVHNSIWSELRHN